jgi:hypothetical protein
MAQVTGTHVAVGTVSIGGTSALTVLLTGWHGFDVAHASAAAALVSMIIGGAYAGIVWFVEWKYPSVPPLPPLPGQRIITP